MKQIDTFLNIDLTGKIPRKFLWKHLLFSFLWILGIIVLFFRIDIYAVKLINPELQWVVGVLPIILAVFILIVIFSQKWYYSLAALFYPFLVIFWFLPKYVMANGKIYLFIAYIDYLFTRLKNFKQTIIHCSLFIVTIMLLLLTDNPYIKWFAMILMSYFYFRFVFGYLKSSFKPAQMFGNNIETALMEYIERDEEGKQKFLESITKETKEDEKLSEEERKKKRLRKLIMWNFGLNFISTNLNGFKGKKAYVLSWVLQLAFFFFISMLYFTFMNYLLFYVDSENFVVQENPNLFDFFYYTLKTVTFNEIGSIKPSSEIAKIIEVSSFLMIGILILIIILSVISLLRQDKIKENIELTTKICSTQNQYIAKHVEDEFGITIQAALKEFSDIKKSIDNLRKMIDKIF